jgi:hypothetical protein
MQQSKENKKKLESGLSTFYNSLQNLKIQSQDIQLSIDIGTEVQKDLSVKIDETKTDVVKLNKSMEKTKSKISNSTKIAIVICILIAIAICFVVGWSVIISTGIFLL